MRVSLAQTAHWFLRMGAPYRASDGFDTDTILGLAANFSEQAPSPYGELTRLRFPIQLQDATPSWGPTVMPGNDPPEWHT